MPLKHWAESWNPQKALQPAIKFLSPPNPPTDLILWSPPRSIPCYVLQCPGAQRMKTRQHPDFYLRQQSFRRAPQAAEGWRLNNKQGYTPMSTEHFGVNAAINQMSFQISLTTDRATFLRGESRFVPLITTIKQHSTKGSRWRSLEKRRNQV